MEKISPEILTELEKLENLSRELDEQLSIVLEIIANKLLNNSANSAEVTSFAFIWRLMQTSALINAIDIDLSNTFYDLGAIATSTQGIEFAKKLVAETQNSHNQKVNGICNCPTCIFLTKELEKLIDLPILPTLDKNKLN